MRLSGSVLNFFHSLFHPLQSCSHQTLQKISTITSQIVFFMCKEQGKTVRKCPPCCLKLATGTFYWTDSFSIWEQSSSGLFQSDTGRRGSNLAAESDIFVQLTSFSVKMWYYSVCSEQFNFPFVILIKETCQDKSCYSCKWAPVSTTPDLFESLKGLWCMQ